MLKTEKRTTIVDIAKQLGVSAKAVSCGLNGTGHISEELRSRIRSTAKELKYRPNLAARRLVTQRSYLVGALLPYTRSSFVGAILDRLEDVTQREGTGLLLGNGAEDPAGVERGIRQMFEFGVSGLVIMPVNANWKTYVKLLEGCDLPIVQIMNPRSEIGSDYVEVNNVMASYTATNYLLGLGHRRIGCLSHDLGDVSMAQRSVGYRMAMSEAKLPFSDYVQDCYHSPEMGYEATMELLRRAPELTAVFCASDYAALGALQAALAHKRQIPEEFSVIGFDDLEFSSMQAMLPLTTMAQPQDAIGTMAGELLLNLIHGKSGNGISLGCELRVRATTAPCRKQY